MQDKIKTFIHSLTLDEKIKLLRGKNRWQTDDLGGKLPSAWLSDGPNGLRKADENNKNIISTAYPALGTLSCSWNAQTVRLYADAIADDCVENDVDVLLGPSINIKRTPVCGRNFEYLSEDPYLCGVMAYNYIDSLQSRGIGASVKHFAANNNENYRHNQNSEMDERTLHEIYLRAFEMAVKAKPWTVMCSYNPVNGIYASENPRLLNTELRGFMGFDGVIVSDWGAVKNRARSLKATLDLEMPYSDKSDEIIKKAYDDGFITEQEIDECAQRVAELALKAEKARKTRKVVRDKAQRHETARLIEEDSLVLLKNDGILPLSDVCTADVFGDADSLKYCGGGSGYVSTDYKIKPLSKTLEENGISASDHWIYDEDCFGEVAFVCVGNSSNEETEGRDRKDIRLYEKQEQTILNVAQHNKRTIVIIYAGSSVDVSRWIDKVSAVIYAGFGGEAVNVAIANVITGKVCPSGKLSETFYASLADCPVQRENEYGLSIFYKERFYFGYRYCDKSGVKPAFAFGHGLSYAQFKYSDLQIEKNDELNYNISYTIENLSDISAKEASQIYVRDCVCSSDRPYKELKGFSKDLIAAHGKKRVTITLDSDAFAFYNTSAQANYVENGKFEILVGAASDDIRLSGQIVIELPEYKQFSSRDCFKFY